MITFQSDQSERLPGLSTNEIKAVSHRLSEHKLKLSMQDLAQLTDQTWTNLVFDLNWKWKFLATVLGIYVIGNLTSI